MELTYGALEKVRADLNKTKKQAATLRALSPLSAICSHWVITRWRRHIGETRRGAMLPIGSMPMQRPANDDSTRQ